MVSEEPAKRQRMIVSGTVQGVFFRANTLRKAKELQVLGWVRNLADGRVEIVAEGAPDAVDALVSWARHGPPTATVTSVEVHDEPVRGESVFRVRNGG
jgi:acylphosphatase